MITASELTPERLLQDLVPILEDDELRATMKDAARAAGKPEAATQAAQIILECVGEGGEVQQLTTNN